MRKILALSGLVLATAAHAHEDGYVLQAEQEAEETSVGDTLMEMLLPEAEAAATINIRGAYRYIQANGYPNKAPGRFPNRGNPNRISKKHYQLRVPVNPHKTGQAQPTRHAAFGIALNGVLMDPATAEFWHNDRRSGWNYEAFGGACRLGLDSFNAHVQPDGTYHYHGVPKGLLASAGGSSEPALIGYAADGFPIYGPYGYSNPKKPSRVKKLKSSYVVKSGKRPSGPGGRYNGKFTQDWTYAAGHGDLDQCNGRFAVTPEYPNGTYQYVLTDDFPQIPRCWMGSPDSSFIKLKKGPGGGNGPGPRMHPPRLSGLFGGILGRGPGAGGSQRPGGPGGPGGRGGPCSGS